MAVCCKDLLELPSLKKLRLVGGQTGLDRIVRWVHVADVPQVTDWVQGGELLFITGIGIQKDSSSLGQLVHSIYEKRLAGLVVNIGPYIEKVSDEVAAIADSLSFPVFDLPWDVKLVDVTADICRMLILNQMEEKSLWDLTESILFGPVNDLVNLIDRAALYGYDLTKQCQISVIDIDNFADYLRTAKLTDEKKILEFKMNFLNSVQGILSNYKSRILFMLRSDSIILLTTEPDITNNYVVNYLAKIQKHIFQKFKGITVSIGVGNPYTHLLNARKSLWEAQLALQVAKVKRQTNQIIAYRDIGYFRILFAVENKEQLTAYYKDVLGKLSAYDHQHGGELLTTLEVFLAENGNLSKATERLFVHRNTLKYRLEKIEQLTEHSLDDFFHRCTLQTAIALDQMFKQGNIDKFMV